MLNCINKIQSAVNKYNTMRNAPDALMLGKNFNINFSVFKRNNKANPIYKKSMASSDMQIAVVDLALIIGLVLAVMMAAEIIIKIKCMIRRRGRCRF